MVANHILDFQPKIYLFAFWLANQNWKLQPTQIIILLSASTRAWTDFRLVLLIFQSGLNKKRWSSVVIMILNRSPLRLYTLDCCFLSFCLVPRHLFYRCPNLSNIRIFELNTADLTRPNLWRQMVWQIDGLTSNIRIFEFDRAKMLFTAVRQWTLNYCSLSH